MKNLLTLTLAIAFTNCVFGQSEQALRDKLASNPNDAQTSFALAEWLKNDKKFDEAGTYYRKAIAIDSTNASYSFGLAYMYHYQTKKLDSAMYYYRKSGRVYTGKSMSSYENPWIPLLELSGNAYDTEYFIEAYDGMMKIKQPGFEYEEKYNMLKGLRDKPTAEGYMKLGDNLTVKQQFNEKFDVYLSRFNSGLNAYDKAVKLDPTKKTAVNTKIAAGLKEIAGSYFTDGYYEDALIYYNKALNYTQKDPEIYSGVGFIKLEKSKTPDYEGALANFQKALALTTASMAKHDVLENIGLVYERKKDFKNAIVYYDRAIAEQPNFSKSVHFKLARVYDAMGNTEKAKYHRARS